MRTVAESLLLRPFRFEFWHAAAVPRPPGPRALIDVVLREILRLQFVAAATALSLVVAAGVRLVVEGGLGVGDRGGTTHHVLTVIHEIIVLSSLRSFLPVRRVLVEAQVLLARVAHVVGLGLHVASIIVIRCVILPRIFVHELALRHRLAVAIRAVLRAHAHVRPALIVPRRHAAGVVVAVKV